MVQIMLLDDMNTLEQVSQAEQVSQVTQVEQAEQAEQAIQDYIAMMTDTVWIDERRFNECTWKIKNLVLDEEEFELIEEQAREACFQVAKSKLQDHYMMSTANLDYDELCIVKMMIVGTKGRKVLNALKLEAKAKAQDVGLVI
jgi:hypothetical protein